MTDPQTKAAADLAAAQEALAARETPASSGPSEELVAQHEEARAALDKAKAVCFEECGDGPDLPADPLERNVAVAEAGVRHAAHQTDLEAAYAEFARADHALTATPQADSNPASPGVTEITADIAVQMDANA